MTRDVTKDLLNTACSPVELEVFLHTYFESSSQTEENKISHAGKFTVEYYGKNNEKHRQIKSIHLMDEKDTDLLEDLKRESSKALASDNGTQIGRVVLFSDSEVKANYRFKNEFQISPIPENAPKPNQLHAQHPFILEFSYQRSCNKMVNMHRSTQTLQTLTLIFNVFLKMGVMPPKNHAHKEWVLVRDERNPSMLETKCVQLGYYFNDVEDRQKDQYGFTIYQYAMDFIKLSPNEYFSPNSFGLGDEFALPDNFDDLISKFFSLSEKDKADFIRASYWKRVSSNTVSISMSNAYVALVNSIESLIPQEVTSGICEHCKKENKKGLTQLFADFVDEYCPGLEEAQRKELYSIRSKYTHGKQLMIGDLDRMGFRFNAAKNDEEKKYRMIANIVQISMINWLCARLSIT